MILLARNSVGTELRIKESFSERIIILRRGFCYEDANLATYFRGDWSSKAGFGISEWTARLSRSSLSLTLRQQVLTAAPNARTCLSTSVMQASSGLAVRRTARTSQTNDRIVL